jgi:hypothetical protein
MFLWVIPWVIPWVILQHVIFDFGTSICPWNVDVRTERNTWSDPLGPGSWLRASWRSRSCWKTRARTGFLGDDFSKQIQLERLRSDCGVLSWPDQIRDELFFVQKMRIIMDSHQEWGIIMDSHQKRGIIMDSHLFGIQDCKRPSDPQTEIQDRLLKSWEARRQALSEARLGRGFYDRQYSISCLYYMSFMITLW